MTVSQSHMGSEALHRLGGWYIQSPVLFSGTIRKLSRIHPCSSQKSGSLRRSCALTNAATVGLQDGTNLTWILPK